MSNNTRNGARAYFYEDGVVLVKQTIQNRNGRYVIYVDSDGNHKERHVDPGDVID